MFEYTTRSSWSDIEDPVNTLNINYLHGTQLNYLQFPLSVKYDLMRGIIRPFIGAGGYYDLLLNASRTIEKSGTDRASGSNGSFTDDPITIGINTASHINIKCIINSIVI